jgi:hypothetical protein
MDGPNPNKVLNMDYGLTPRNIGAWFDKLFLIGYGIYLIYGVKYSINMSVKSGKLSAEKAEKQIKKLNFYGWLVLSAGIFLLLLAFAHYGYRLSP